MKHEKSKTIVHNFTVYTCDECGTPDISSLNINSCFNCSKDICDKCRKFDDAEHEYTDYPTKYCVPCYNYYLMEIRPKLHKIEEEHSDKETIILEEFRKFGETR